MSRLFKGVILIALLLLVKVSNAQNYYNSPYTRYLIGDVINSGFAYNKALGGSSIALRPHNQINYLNPASYTTQDTNSFILQLGFTGRHAKILTGIDSDESVNFNMDYLAIGFPATKWWNISVGLTPYSRIQYSFREELNESDIGEKMTFDYTGFGGFNEFYFGNAFSISDIVSLGFNASYLFGSLDRKQISYLDNRRATSASIEKKSNYIASDFYFKFGLQVHPTIQEKHRITAGFTYDIESNISVKLKGQTTRNNTAVNYETIDSLYFNVDTSTPLILPTKIALGLAYTYNNQLTVNAEYINQDWSGTKIEASSFKAGLYESYRFGVEFIPTPLENRTRVSYFKRINYRTGAFFTKTYLYSGDKNISSSGVSAGIGLPIKNARKIFSGTNLNIGYQYGVRGTTENGLIKEKYQIITFGLTLHDFWFLKPKYD